MEYTSITIEALDDLKDAQEELRQATAYYESQVDLFRAGAGSELELKRAYGQQRQCYLRERELAPALFPLLAQSCPEPAV